jgi:hypothetical protein
MSDFPTRIIEILRSCPSGLSTKDIAVRLGTTVSNVSSRLSKLAAYGVIGKVRGTLAIHGTKGAVYRALRTIRRTRVQSSSSQILDLQFCRLSSKCRGVESAAARRREAKSETQSARPIDRMIGVQRPTVQSNVRAKSARLDKSFRRIVTPLAQALKRHRPEFVDVAMVRRDVITNFCRSDDAALQAELAERMREQLLLPNPGPAICGVPPVPFRWSTANAHGSNYHLHFELEEMSRINREIQRMQSTAR